MNWLVLIAAFLGAFAAVGAYVKAHGLHGAVEDLHESVDEIKHDLYEDLRADLAAAIAEGADQVISKLPQRRAPRAPLAPDTAPPASGALK